MAIEVPLGALNELREHQQQLDEDGVVVGISREALELVLAFVETFEPRALPNMVGGDLPIAGEMASLTFIDPTVEAEEIDLIRLNGRVFVPEVVASFEDSVLDMDPGLLGGVDSGALSELDDVTVALIDRGIYPVGESPRAVDFTVADFQQKPADILTGSDQPQSFLGHADWLDSSDSAQFGRLGK